MNANIDSTDTDNGIYLKLMVCTKMNSAGDDLSLADALGFMNDMLLY